MRFMLAVMIIIAGLGSAMAWELQWWNAVVTQAALGLAAASAIMAYREINQILPRIEQERARAAKLQAADNGPQDS
jgi:uncharacterized membrane protein